jgi:hypothetical protein
MERSSCGLIVAGIVINASVSVPDGKDFPGLESRREESKRRPGACSFALLLDVCCNPRWPRSI